MIKLWDDNKIPYYNKEYQDGFMPSITPYIVENAKTCILICPGGGYRTVCTDHEGVQIANYLNKLGISAFMLEYRIAPYKHPTEITDAKRAMRYVRYLAKEYGYDKHKIGAMGFSAGGHLAGCLGVFDSDFGYEPQDEIDKESSKPDFLILCYPALSLCQYAHRGTFVNLSEDLSNDAAVRLSVEKNVSETTPPTFLFHTIGDCDVPVENSILMAKALSRHKVKFELHTYTHGMHGVALCDRDFQEEKVKKYTSFWKKNLHNWLRSMNYLD
ncbi:MAG: alpha/beta hydrolase [Ruminococcaceae bacterium]|nr:alpha/beta hydrolase [Oscillospiraceae bacterium]